MEERSKVYKQGYLLKSPPLNVSGQTRGLKVRFRCFLWTLRVYRLMYTWRHVYSVGGNDGSSCCRIRSADSACSTTRKKTLFFETSYLLALSLRMRRSLVKEGCRFQLETVGISLCGWCISLEGSFSSLLTRGEERTLSRQMPVVDFALFDLQLWNESVGWGGAERSTASHSTRKASEYRTVESTCIRTSSHRHALYVSEYKWSWGANSRWMVRLGWAGAGAGGESRFWVSSPSSTPTSSALFPSTSWWFTIVQERNAALSEVSSDSVHIIIF